VKGYLVSLFNQKELYIRLLLIVCQGGEGEFSFTGAVEPEKSYITGVFYLYS
jgi:hypothetical protein